MYQPPSKTPAVELIHCSAPGRSLAPIIGPDRYGLFAMAFETGDLDGLVGAIRAAGFDVLSWPVEMVSGLHGPVRAATVRGPNGVLIECFARA